jgi:cytochrome c peroxidase
VALLDLPAMERLAEATPPEAVDRLSQDVEVAERLGLMRRVDSGVIGPRAFALDSKSSALVVAGHFSEDLALLDAKTGAVRTTVALGPKVPLTLRRQGELLFNDARITYQTWFSCVSCHEEDAGLDALNWDLPNDGTGNSKNVKSLHDAHDTPPAMWTGVRADMSAAVMAGQRFQGFLPRGPNQAALDAYLGHLTLAPNPHRTRHPDQVARGAKLFDQALCSTCHPGPRFTDLTKHDLGLGAKTDLASRFDTPSLRECYRSAPYLHDGRAPTLESIFLEHDPLGVHGRTRELSPAELSDLLEYVRSL